MFLSALIGLLNQVYFLNTWFYCLGWPLNSVAEIKGVSHCIQFKKKKKKKTKNEAKSEGQPCVLELSLQWCLFLTFRLMQQSVESVWNMAFDFILDNVQVVLQQTYGAG